MTGNALNTSLEFIETIEVELTFDLNPIKYYDYRRSGLCVYRGFNGGWLVQQAKPLPAGTKFRLNVHRIGSNADDAQTEKALKALGGGSHLLDPTTICGAFAAMMSLQPNGEEGHLINYGKDNLAYTGSGVANVRRNMSEWTAGTWHRDGVRWNAGALAFSPVTDPTTL